MSDAPIEAPALQGASRRYVPEELAVKQLSKFNGVSPGGIVELLFSRDAAQSDERVCEEVLVTLLRRCASAGEEDAAWRIASELANRVKGRIVRTLKLWRLDAPEAVAEEVIADIITALYAAVFDASPREQFWEIRFWVAFDRKALKIIQAKRAELDSRYDPNRHDEESGATVVEQMAANSAAAEQLSDPLTGALVGEALALLTSSERTAFILKHVARMPEDSMKDDGPLTIARVLNVSPRTVRNYLSRAEKILANWRQHSAPPTQRDAALTAK